MYETLQKTGFKFMNHLVNQLEHQIFTSIIYKSCTTILQKKMIFFAVGFPQKTFTLST